MITAKIGNPIDNSDDGVRTLALISYVFLIVDGIFEIIGSLLVDLSTDSADTGMSGVDLIMIGLAICIACLVYMRSDYNGDQLVQSYIKYSWRVFRSYLFWYACFIGVALLFVFLPFTGLNSIVARIFSVAAYIIPLLFLFMGAKGLIGVKNSKEPDDKLLRSIEVIK